MIDQARKHIEDGKIDTYSMEYGGPGFIVTVKSGAQTGQGQAETEEKALSAALRDLAKSKS